MIDFRGHTSLFRNSFRGGPMKPMINFPMAIFFCLQWKLEEQIKLVHSSFAGNSTLYFVVAGMVIGKALAVSTNGRFQPGGQGP